MGGGLGGAATALLLKRRRPDLRVVVIDKSTRADRKVGEATTEVSACFLSRVLGLTAYLAEEHLPKMGLRLWFAGGDGLEECAEIGGRYQPRLGAYQVDRARLDAHVGEEARRLGCEVIRPARVRALEAGGEGNNVLEIEAEGERRTLRARFVVDASGRAALLARRLGLFERIEEHPTHAIWARFRGVADWDGAGMAERFPGYFRAARVSRTLATNHLLGYGWWCWMIPLKGGDVSVGLVYDERLYTPPPGDNLAARLLEHVRQHPAGREMMERAEPVEGDARALGHLPYRSRRVAGDGWYLVGDAAGFLDPLYSPGLDFLAWTTCRAVDHITRRLDGETPCLDSYNEQFRMTFDTWLRGVYLDKYKLLGDRELMSIAFRFDLAAYFLGPVKNAYEQAPDLLLILPIRDRIGRMVSRGMCFLHRRLVRLAERRRRLGLYGRRNARCRDLVAPFAPDGAAVKHLLRGLRAWAAMECATALREIFARPESVSAAGGARAAVPRSRMPGSPAT